MKRRLLMTMMAMVLAFTFTGCGNKKADETTATTEAASEVKDEFIKLEQISLRWIQRKRRS